MIIKAKTRLRAAKEVVDPYKIFDFYNTQHAFNDILKPNEIWYYKKAKQAYAKIVPMTFREYLENCAEARGRSKSSWILEERSMTPSNVDGIAEAMKAGQKFRAPNIDYYYSGQEGRHRCAAIAKLNGKDYKIPVVCIYKWTPAIQEKELGLPYGWYIKDNWLHDIKNKAIMLVERDENQFKKDLVKLKESLFKKQK